MSTHSYALTTAARHTPQQNTTNTPRLQEHLNGPTIAGAKSGRRTPPLASAAPLGAAAAFRGAVLKFDAPVRPAAASGASALDPSPEAAILESGIVRRVEPDRYVSIQQAQCVPGAALAGAMPAVAPEVEWEGCATKHSTLVWFGERCNNKFDKARYNGVMAVHKGECLVL